MMRVCFVPSWYPRPGAEFNGTFFREQALMLAGSGIEMSILAAEPCRVETGRWLAPARLQIEDGMRVVRLELPALPARLASVEARLHRLLLGRAARLLARGGVPDIVHAHTVFPGGTTGARLSELWGAPLVITEHRPSSIDASAFRARRQRIEGAVEGAALLTTVSQGFADALAEHYQGTRWLPIELPVPELFFAQSRAEAAADAPTRFLHVSHIDGNKRVVETCRAFAEAFPEPDSAVLRIIGGDAEAIASAKKRLGAIAERPDLEFLGRRTRDETAGAMASCEVFVLVSAIEAGGTVLSEAQAAGARILASDTWAGGFAVREGIGELVPVDDHRALVEAMRRIAHSEGYASHAEIRERARGRYSECSFVERWTSLYRGLLDDTEGAEDEKLGRRTPR